MSHSRVNQFGPEFQELLLTAFENPPLRFPLESKGQAVAFRARIYFYFRLLREENIRLDLIEMADNIHIGLEGSCLVLGLKSDNWENTKIREVLGLHKDFGRKEFVGDEELKTPDLLQNRLMRQIKAIRKRKTEGTEIVEPYKMKGD